MDASFSSRERRAREVCAWAQISHRALSCAVRRRGDQAEGGESKQKGAHSALCSSQLYGAIQASVKPMTRTVTLVGTLSLLASPTLASTLKSAREYLMLNRRSTMDSALSEAYFSQHAAFALDVRRSAPWEVSDAIFEEYVLHIASWTSPDENLVIFR